MTENSNIGRWGLAWVASLVLHGAAAGLFWQGDDFLDPDLLGARGGKQWAEQIALAEATGELASLAVIRAAGHTTGAAIETPIYSAQKAEEITPIPVKDQTSGETAAALEEAPPELPQTATAAVEEAETGEEIATQPEEEILPADEAQQTDATGEIAARAQARGGGALAALEAGRDVSGAGVGAAEGNRQGLFVSGEEIKVLLEGWTLVGTNGFSDGSIAASGDKKRQSAEWRVYYRGDGTLEARYMRLAAARPHGPLAMRQFTSSGKWWVKENWLCQAIVKWFSGGQVCFEVRRDGKALAMYYADCWGVARCYRGRLGPEGHIYPGRKLY